VASVGDKKQISLSMGVVRSQSTFHLVVHSVATNTTLKHTRHWKLTAGPD